jgi:transcriptional regulator with XRE-family HTH domain
MNLKFHIGTKVKSARKGAGLTQARLAETLDRAVETISNIERGQALPGLELLVGIAEATNQPLGAFLEGYDPKRRVSAVRLAAEEQLEALVKSLNDKELALAIRLIRAMR